MLPIADSFEHTYRGCDLFYGRGCVDRLGEYLADHNLNSALIVCGSNVGANDDLMGPVRAGLGDRLAGIFDGTTPEKAAESAFDAIDRLHETDADVLIGIGGGSSLDIARQASVFAGDGRSLAALREEAQTGTISPPEPGEDAPPVVVLPTTFAGADVSAGGTLDVLPASESPTDQPVIVGGSRMPIADFADPNLFETTPPSVLSGSAMNGFDKGIETPYARDADPVSDAAAVHGLRLLRDSLPAVASGSEGPETMDRAVVGSLLVQLDRKVSIVHAFGHGFARRYDVQQGAVHAVVVPHVLRYLFGQVDGSRALLAEGLGIDTGAHSHDELGETVVEGVIEVRDGVGAPSRLRDLSGPKQADLPAIAAFIVNDPPMDRAPVDPDPEAIEAVLREAW